MRRALAEAIGVTFQDWEQNRCPYQVLMLGGDDLLLACRAKFALPLVINYAAALDRFACSGGLSLSVGVGVAIAKPNFPFHRLHALAEALAGSAKRLHRARQDGKQVSVADWMVITSAWAEDPLRERQRNQFVRYRTPNGQIETLALSARPYPVLDTGTGQKSLQGLWKAAQELHFHAETTTRVARSQLRDWVDQAPLGRRWAEEAFNDIEDKTRTALKKHAQSVWEEVGDNCYLTRLADLIELYEIAHLGRREFLTWRVAGNT